MTFDDIADELYGLPLEEFTAARNARARAVRDDGDRELAERVKALGKPTIAGWLVNRLVREHADEVAPLRELGGRLREATEQLQGDQLRALSRQRHRLVGALVGRARAVASAAGRRVGDQVAHALEQTFDAALADPDAAEQVLAGRLTDALQPQGFVLGAVTPAGDPASGKNTAKKDTAGAERALAGAELRAQEAQAAACEAEQHVADLEQQLSAARKEAGRRRQAVRRAEQAVAKARARLR